MMRRVRAWMLRVRDLFGGRPAEADFNAELESHLQLHIDDNLRAGMSPAEARRHASITLGGIEGVREAHRDRRRLPLIDVLRRDVRFASRQLRRSPGFAAAAILVLALGMASTVTILAFVDAALLRPLPYQQPTRLVDVTESVKQIPRDNLSYQDYLDWKRMNTVFAAFDAYTGSGFMMNTPSGARPVTAVRVTAGFFRTLGITPAIGRDFRDEEGQPGAAETVVLSHVAWQKYFGGQASILGQTITLDSAPHQVIGILPPQFEFAPAGTAEMWTPITTPRGCEQRRSCHNLYGVARLKDGVSIEAARAELVGIAARLEQQYPDSNRGQGAVVAPLSEVAAGNVRPALLLLLGGVVLLQVIACLNVSSLLLVRTDSRQRELAVRRAIGASRSRLAAQFTVEALVLVISGTALGLVAAWFVVPALVHLIPADLINRMPYLQSMDVSGRLIAGVAGIVTLSTLVLAVTPLVRLSRSDAIFSLAEGSRGSSGRTWRRLGARLVVVELIIAVVLLVGAGLLGRSAYRLMHAELGFEPTGLASIRLAAFGPRFEGHAAAVGLSRTIAEQVGRIPGVTAVGHTSVRPVSFNGNTTWIRIVGQPFNGEHNEVNYRQVSASYFETLKVQQIRGRRFADADDAAHPRVVMINQALQRRYFPNEDPIGQRIGNTGLTPDSIVEVVGVVADLREGGLDDEIWPAVYYPFNQDSDTSMALIVRTAVPPASILPALDSIIRGIDPNIGTMSPTTIEDYIDASPSAYMHRSTAWLVAAFAGAAWALGVIGLYGVLAYLVSQRTREIGVRLALGAERHTVAGMVVREAGKLAVAGVGVGMLLAVGIATLMRALLFSTAPWDAPTLAVVAVVLVCSALAASYVPARRAAAVNPIDALRAE
ncbi:MAG: ABC transporter permease [Acidobacteriota bacterium]